MKSQKSGLVRYLFGEKLDGELQKETFKDLQSKLIDDVLSLEFTRYCSKTEKMTEEDFCRHMLYTSSLTSKKKEKMLAMVSKRFKGKGPGIAFSSFKNPHCSGFSRRLCSSRCRCPRRPNRSDSF